MTDVELLVEAGRALYGDRWQTDMAAALGLSDARRIRQWLTGDRPTPPGIWKDLLTLIDERNQAMLNVRAQIASKDS